MPLHPDDVPDVPDEQIESIRDVQSALIEVEHALVSRGTQMFILDIGAPRGIRHGLPTVSPDLNLWPNHPLPILPCDGDRPVGFGAITSSSDDKWVTSQIFIRRDCPERLTLETDPKGIHLAPVVRGLSCIALKFCRGPFQGVIQKE